jgi:cyclopropane-fatty-acyl-phospholipid synthase
MRHVDQDMLSTEYEDTASSAPTAQREPSNAAGGGWRSAIERWFTCRLLNAVGNPPMCIALPDGQQVTPPQGESSPLHRVVVRDRSTLWRLILDPRFQFGETYSEGRLEVEGDLVQFLRDLYRCGLAAENSGRYAGRVAKWLHRPRRNSLAGSRENIHHHYDIGNDFYRLWLDEQLVYTCAYFAEPSYTLEKAQIAKMDHVCRKLRLRPEETVMEAGCGWGSLALHMARHYGVRVRAFNISREQIAYARDRCRREGLEDRVEYVLDDWRTMRGKCDVFVSVGMLEHVGPANYRELGDVIHRLIGHHGRGLIHTIGRNKPRSVDPWIERRIFPGGYPPSLGELMQIFEPREFSIHDVENIRLHYAETLRHWRVRFEKAVDRVREMFDERFVRMWRLYLAGSQAAFDVGSLQLFQVLFAPGSSNDVPLTRAYQYEPGGNGSPAGHLGASANGNGSLDRAADPHGTPVENA